MDWTKQIGRYIVVMLLQVLLFNQLQLWDVCHPYIYILCLLMMPITIPHWLSMVLGAVAGLVMDVFCNSLGIHMAACVLLMYIRPYLIGAIVNDKDRLNEQISTQAIGLGAMFEYTIIMVLLHHLAVFTMAAWSWKHIGFVLFETLVSSIVTILVIMGYNSMRDK